MRTVTRDLLAMTTLTLLGTLALSGCASEPAPRVSESTAPTDAPVFASDAEALAAATEAYAAYLRVIDTVLGDGGSDSARLAAVTSDEALRAETKAASFYSDQGYRSVGSTSFDSLQLQFVEDDGQGSTILSAYLCSDVAGVDVVDSAGASVVPADRVDRFPLQVRFQNLRVASKALLITSSDSWTGKNFC